MSRFRLPSLGQIDIIEYVKVGAYLYRRQMPRIPNDKREEEWIVGVFLGFRFEGGDLRPKILDLSLQVLEAGRNSNIKVVCVVISCRMVVVMDRVLQENVVGFHISFLLCSSMVLVGASRFVVSPEMVLLV